jgi:hypothetical protein
MTAYTFGQATLIICAQTPPLLSTWFEGLTRQANLNSVETTYRLRRQALADQARALGLPLDMKSRMMDTFDFRWQRTCGAEDATELLMLSDALRSEVLAHTLREIVVKVAQIHIIFRGGGVFSYLVALFSNLCLNWNVYDLK